jgi:hypothetical protein
MSVPDLIVPGESGVTGFFGSGFSNGFQPAHYSWEFGVLLLGQLDLVGECHDLSCC